MFIGKLIPIALLVVANSSLTVNLLNPLFESLFVDSNSNVVQPSVDIRRTYDGHLTAVVKNSPEYPNTIFVLKSATPVQFTSPKILNNVEIYFGGEYVTFRSKIDGSNLTFQLTNSTNPVPNTGNIGVYKGFGLIKQREPSNYGQLFSFAGPTYPPIQESVHCDCLEAGSNDKNCGSGGAGASACSYDESAGGGSVSISMACSVTCGTGYFACCYDN